MRRPLCVFCAGALGVCLAYAFLPQTGLLLPLAAFFVAACLLVALWGGAVRGYGLCLLLGAAAGCALMLGTDRRIAAVQQRYAGRTVALRAEVESTSASYYDGVVNAVLHVVEAGGEAADFRCEGVAIPTCTAGEYIEGRFALEIPPQTQRTERYADGVVLEAECSGELTHAGPSGSFRARTARVQQALSKALCSRLSENVGGVLAAMVLGDRNALPKAMNDAYRAAGLSHVLVVSGMHVSILCGDVFAGSRRKKERSYAARRVRALWSSLLALGLIGVTGFTPSVLRAAVAVWISALGVWVYGPPDALTSLGMAGLLMSLPNGYAACDVGFELSFAAVLGTLAGANLARRGRAAWAARRRRARAGQPRRTASLWQRTAAKLGGGLWDTLCVSLCASAGTFPVLVLRGLSASLYALVSSVAVLWLVDPIMYLGLAAAAVGVVPFAGPLAAALSYAAGLLTYLLNRWAVLVSGWPGAQIYFDTSYAAVVCLLLIALCALASHWHVRLRVSVPAVVLLAAVALGLGNALNYNVVHVELVGSGNAPAVVISQNGSAVVLLRGGAATQQAVETALARRGVQEAELLIDLRMNPASASTIPAQRTVEAAQQPAYTTQTAVQGCASAEIFRTRSGCAVRLKVCGLDFVTVSGTVELAKPVHADWLLAGMSRPGAFRWEHMLSLRDNYQWMDGETIDGTSLALRPGGGMRVGE